jgi:hypothetical protein
MPHAQACVRLAQRTTHTRQVTVAAYILRAAPHVRGVQCGLLIILLPGWRHSRQMITETQCAALWASLASSAAHSMRQTWQRWVRDGIIASRSWWPVSTVGVCWHAPSILRHLAAWRAACRQLPG